MVINLNQKASGETDSSKTLLLIDLVSHNPLEQCEKVFLSMVQHSTAPWPQVAN